MVSAGPGPAVVEAVNTQLYSAAGVNPDRETSCSMVMTGSGDATPPSSEVQSMEYVTLPLGANGGSQVNDTVSGVSGESIVLMFCGGPPGAVRGGREETEYKFYTAT